MKEIDRIYSLEGQPARKRKDYSIEVYLGRGRWKKYDDPTGSFAYAFKLTDEEAKELIAEWDKDPARPSDGGGGEV